MKPLSILDLLRVAIRVWDIRSQAPMCRCGHTSNYHCFDIVASCSRCSCKKMERAF